MTENVATNAPDPQVFDIDEWLVDAKLPHASVDLYKAGTVPAEALSLKEQITLEREILSEEPSAADKSKLRKLESRYTSLVEAWLASKITVFVSALSSDHLRALRADNEKKTEGMDKAVANEIFGYELLSAAIVGVAQPGVEYTEELPYEPVKWEPRHIRGLEKKIGTTQTSQLLVARQAAQNQMPTVDADFLHSSSGSATGDTPA